MKAARKNKNEISCKYKIKSCKYIIKQLQVVTKKFRYEIFIGNWYINWYIIDILNALVLNISVNINDENCPMMK